MAGNPLRYIDPTGHTWEETWDAIVDWVSDIFGSDEGESDGGSGSGSTGGGSGNGEGGSEPPEPEEIWEDYRELGPDGFHEKYGSDSDRILEEAIEGLFENGRPLNGNSKVLVAVDSSRAGTEGHAFVIVINEDGVGELYSFGPENGGFFDEGM